MGARPPVPLRHLPSRIASVFLREYEAAVVFHLKVQFDDPEERFLWYKKMTLKLAALERKVFLADFEKAFMLLFGGCLLCKECKTERTLCEQPERARPAPEGMGVDVCATVRKIGYPISVRTEMTQPMDRYVLMGTSKSLLHRVGQAHRYTVHGIDRIPADNKKEYRNA